eukprot:NODE_261_length_11439_cov_1.285538.p11 type:complete len:144 gc:universal NODE_261_length_11439_cov_1.285538:9742-9311(-)
MQFLFFLTLASLKIRIVNPTSTSTWSPGQQVYIVWDVLEGNGKLTFNLMDNSQGNNDAPLLQTIANDVDSDLKKLNYTVPSDVKSGKVSIQALPADGSPQYSTVFTIGEKQASSTGENGTNSTSSASIPQMIVMFAILSGLLV